MQSRFTANAALRVQFFIVSIVVLLSPSAAFAQFSGDRFGAGGNLHVDLIESHESGRESGERNRCIDAANLRGYLIHRVVEPIRRCSTASWPTRRRSPRGFTAGECSARGWVLPRPRRPLAGRVKMAR